MCVHGREAQATAQHAIVAYTQFFFAFHYCKHTSLVNSYIDK